ncbi:putative transmembrane helical domain containing protein [Klebsiella phage KP8]|uniref:Putative transmembrane helical domain containing protein n=1 Tax=Klebsiella phage KP8 TaxID=2099850 RepID=A0A2P1CCJ3_9CAUD|nr:putative transmembrane helical domain containing protein [Klebsiella phage KP8]AVJ48941.1 putative transmembrane helical domain containing protein [Klebsiella phage KP8]
MKEDYFFIFVAGVAIGVLIMGLLMTHIGPNSKAKVDARKAECELNIPRNQNCVMRFVPEKVKQ